MTSFYNPNEASHDILKALGVYDKDIIAATIRLRVGRAPTITVQRHLIERDAMKSITDRYELVTRKMPPSFLGAT